jgi:hypothetical protein
MAASTSERLSDGLRRVIELRRELAADREVAQRWLAVKQWQGERLRRTYPDLLASARFRPACEFFLAELYGAKNFEQRDREALRVVPKLVKMLPERAVETITLAVELDGLSESLDARLAREVRLPIDVAGYAQAYRETGTEEERARQIDEVNRIGRALDKLARVPLLAGLLHLMRGPAEAAGLGHLHHFLETGFASFKHMGPANAFLDIVRRRETALMRSLFDGETALLEDPAQLVSD